VIRNEQYPIFVKAYFSSRIPQQIQKSETTEKTKKSICIGNLILYKTIKLSWLKIIVFIVFAKSPF
jgi:hypothetical protein